MRALFLWQIAKQHSAVTFDEAEEIIKAFPDHPMDPKDSELEALSDAKLMPLLKALKDTTIHELRNRVVHKQAYRPTREEVEDSLKETRCILFPLTYRLRLHDEPNWYMAHS